MAERDNARRMARALLRTRALPRLLVGALWLSACAAKPPAPARSPAPAPAAAGARSEALLDAAGRTAAGRPDGQAWLTQRGTEHPWTGRIWSARARRFITWSELLEAVGRADFVLLGEEHDNPDHHALQAAVLMALGAQGVRPAVVFEMLEPGLNEELAEVQAAGTQTTASLRELTEWDQSGWPEFGLYEPLFAEIARAGLLVSGAGLSREAAMPIALRGLEAVEPALVSAQGLALPMTATDHEALLVELHDAHCRLMPKESLTGMVLVQRVRDALMTAELERRLMTRPSGAPVVLIAGSGHTRTDYAVPALLARHHRPSLSVTFRTPSAQDAGEPAATPHDYVVYTPAPDREDPCVRLREHLGTAHPPTGAPVPQPE